MNAFTRGKEAKKSQQTFIVTNSQAFTPSASVIGGRQLGRNIAANRDDSELSSAPGPPSRLTRHPTSESLKILRRRGNHRVSSGAKNPGCQVTDWPDLRQQVWLLEIVIRDNRSCSWPAEAVDPWHEIDANLHIKGTSLILNVQNVRFQDIELLRHVAPEIGPP